MLLMFEANSNFSSALSLDTVIRMSVDQYHAMIAAEIFMPEDQVELLIEPNVHTDLMSHVRLLLTAPSWA